MFVLRSTYDRVVNELTKNLDRVTEAKKHYVTMYYTCAEDYHQLVVKYNELLFHYKQSHVGGAGFTQAEIKQLLRLCHPDKHNNSDTSNEITKKLLGMRTK